VKKEKEKKGTMLYVLCDREHRDLVWFEMSP
jgi:hypothetical protein